MFYSKPYIPRQHCYPSPMRARSTNANDINLISSEGVGLTFPSYLREISLSVDLFPQNADNVSTKYSFKSLDNLLALVKLLPSAARNIYAESAPMQDIYQVTEVSNHTNLEEVTILVNSLVHNATLTPLNRLNNRELYELLSLTNSLTIPSLLNAVSRVIASRIYDVVETEKNRIEEEYPGNYTLVETLISSVKTTTQNTLPYQLVTPIAKFIYLQSLAVTEKTIADYIGINGIFSAMDGNKIKLSNKQITGISGFELFRDLPVELVYLFSNYILGADLDLNFQSEPFALFTNLKEINLRDNQLTKLPTNFFINQRKLQILDLSENNLTQLPNRIFNNELKSLRLLDLTKNRLQSLQVGLFDQLVKLENLMLDHNQLTEIPNNLLTKLKNLVNLSLEGNLLQRIGVSAFEGVTNINRLYLQDNKITTLPIDVFLPLEKLNLLMLDHNFISFLRKGVFNGLKRLRFLMLSHNILPQPYTTRDEYNGYLRQFKEYHSLPTNVHIGYSPQYEPNT